MLKCNNFFAFWHILHTSLLRFSCKSRFSYISGIFLASFSVFLRHHNLFNFYAKNRNTMQLQSRLPSLRFTMRTYCRTPVEKERFDLSVRQVLRKSRSATLSTAYCIVFLFSRSLCQRKIWILAVYAVKSTWHQGKYGLDYKCKKGCEKTQSSFSHPPFFVSYFAFFTANNAYY